ncbi:hypothetical protein [Dietzia psychralcaliphila]|uniref:Transmembrane protein n=1 Tax=Dietzia psychralcaliphila TaxID=139021 RepID=A0AAD0NNH7_9ACTN|nr:hypothetical protein [Dietzia psychralcaliphila]AWH95922.1 hypothetical protein A6048_10840 [Dietzia psychralcaliphila]PTM85882.1 hypothetical protein C8N39_10963 [Dietzia psychralcaliphila]
MARETFVALAGAFAVLFLVTTVWTAWQVNTHGADQVSAPVFPAMTLGALLAVVVMKFGSNRGGSRALIALVAAVISFALVTFVSLGAWFLLAG